MAVTHSDDTSQRLVDLPVCERDVCHLHVDVTENRNLAPPGWYLLFLCNKAGIPSVARWIHLDRPPAKPRLGVGEKELLECLCVPVGEAEAVHIKRITLDVELEDED